MDVVDPARLISVVIPCFNNGRYLGAAIDSVLAQRHRPLEILVVDDGSTDESAAVASRYGIPVKVLSQSNRGISSARNTGIKASSGELLAFLDADDLWSREKLAMQMRVLDGNSSIECVFSHAEQFHSADLAPDERAKIHCPSGSLPAKVASSMLIRRAAFMNVGLFDESLRVAEFVDWMARGARAGLRVELLPDVLLRRRLHRTNTGRTQRHTRSDYARALKAALDGRRKKAIAFP